MTNSAEELKSCPFCGWDDCGDVASNDPPSLYHVFCAGCVTEGPCKPSREEAIAAWNTRRAESSLQGDVVERVIAAVMANVSIGVRCADGEHATKLNVAAAKEAVRSALRGNE